MPGRIVIASLLLSLVAASSAPAAEIGGSGFSSGNWSGEAYAEGDAFSYCAISTPYRSGIRLHFAIDKDYLWRMGLSHQDWGMQPGGTLPLRYQIDRNGVNTGEARVVDAKFLMVELPAREEVFNQFRRGRQLNVEAGDQLYSFELKGTSRALSRVLACVNTQRKRRPAVAEESRPPVPPAAMTLDGRMPVMTEPEAPAALLKPAAGSGTPVASPTAPLVAPLDPAQPPTAAAALELPERASPLEHRARGGDEPVLAVAPQDMLDATRFAIGLFATGELAGNRLIEPRDLPSQATDFQRGGAVAWLAPAGFGTIHVFQPLDAGAEALIDEAIARDVRRCRGAFASGRKPFEADPSLSTAYASCAPTTGDGFHTDYAAFRHASGKLYLLSSQRDGGANADGGNADALARTVAMAIR